MIRKNYLSAKMFGKQPVYVLCLLSAVAVLLQAGAVQGGSIKKCLCDGKVIYTDRGCPCEQPEDDVEHLSDLLNEAIGYYTGTSGGVETEEAGGLFTELAEHGNVLAKMWLARCHIKGTAGITKNKKYASEIAGSVIEKVKELAEDGDSRAMFLLGDAFQQNLGVSKNYKKAFFWHGKGCAKGEAISCGNLGSMHMEGQGVSPDAKEALRLYRKACDMKYYHGCFAVGSLYEKGRGVIRDYRKALEFYRKSCDGGDASGCNNFAELLMNGKGVKQDYNKAAELYQKACDRGEFKACNSLGTMYTRGYGLRRNYQNAIQLYRKACDGGEKEGCKNLSVNCARYKSDYCP